MTKESGRAAEASTAASERIELKGLFAMMLGVWYPKNYYSSSHRFHARGGGGEGTALGWVWQQLGPSP
jgi:hypothetical protein